MTLREPLLTHYNVGIGEYDESDTSENESTLGSVSFGRWSCQVAIWIATVSVGKIVVFMLLLIERLVPRGAADP